MDKLYVFAIGGSGERVLRSLIMMLTSGVEVGANQIVPVFVDNDVDSDALKKCERLISYYNSDPAKGGKWGANTIYSYLTGDSKEWPSFFKTKIAQPINLNKSGNNIGNLSNVIGALDSRNNPVHAAIEQERDLLYSQDDCEMPLNVGFVGNPNIGSVVLKSLSFSETDFTDICAAGENDGVFVIGSLFGGTGAAGFPLVINSINSGGGNPLKGGVALLPYFETIGEELDGPLGSKWKVLSDQFEVKTRAALMYYDQYMSGNRIDYMYYVGDGANKEQYQYCIGGGDQQNPAHIVEVMAALSIVDFSKQTKPDKVVYKIPVWGTGGATMTESNLDGVVNKDLKRSLVKFELMKQLFANNNFLKNAISEKRAYVNNIGFDSVKCDSVIQPNGEQSYTWAYGVNKLIAEWTSWMNELSRNNAIRRFLVYDEASVATANDITMRFYTEKMYGIAKMQESSGGFFSNIFGGHAEPTPMKPEIDAALIKAFNQLYPKGVNVQDEKVKLPMLLQIISKALDDVIDNRCSL